MADKTQRFEGPIGEQVTDQNTGGASGDPITSPTISGNGMAVFAEGAAMGSTCVRVTGAQSTGLYSLSLLESGATSARAQLRFNVDSTKPPTGAALAFFRARNSSGNVMKLVLSTSNVLSVQNAAGSGLKNFNGGAALADGWWVANCQMIRGTSTSPANGTIAVQLWRQDTQTQVDSYSSSAVNTGTTNIIVGSIGKPEAASGGTDILLDHFLFGTGSSTPYAIDWPAEPSEGAAAGTVSWAGAAAGKEIPKASASGGVTFDGSAAGQRTPKAAAAGTVAWAGSSSGARTAKAAAAGGFTYTGAAAGARQPQGAVAGAVTWAGAAAGGAPTVAEHTGIAAGSVAWAGSAEGSRSSRGSAAGTAAWAGAAAGKRTPEGSAGGAFTYGGAAAGRRAPKAAAAGSVAWAGSAAGSAVERSTGAAAGAVTWAGSAAGRRQPKASAAGAYAYAGSAAGAAARFGATVGAFTYAGSAAGRFTPRGAAEGAVVWDGSAAGGVPAVAALVSVSATVRDRPGGATVGSDPFTATVGARRYE